MEIVAIVIFLGGIAATFFVLVEEFPLVTLSIALVIFSFLTLKFIIELIRYRILIHYELIYLVCTVVLGYWLFNAYQGHKYSSDIIQNINTSPVSSLVKLKEALASDDYYRKNKFCYSSDEIEASLPSDNAATLPLLWEIYSTAKTHTDYQCNKRFYRLYLDSMAEYYLKKDETRSFTKYNPHYSRLKESGHSIVVFETSLYDAITYHDFNSHIIDSNDHEDLSSYLKNLRYLVNINEREVTYRYEAGARLIKPHWSVTFLDFKKKRRFGEVLLKGEPVPAEIRVRSNRREAHAAPPKEDFISWHLKVFGNEP